MQKSNEILKVHQLYVAYGSAVVVRDVNFALKKGEFMGIVGESGCGKSTMLRSLMMIKGNNTCIRGNIVYEGTDITELPDEELRRLRGDQISMIPQNAFCSMDPTKTIGSLFYETVKMHRKNIGRKECDIKSAELMERLLLNDTQRILKSYPFELSGGMCQRIAIALSMINSPKLILADEPTSALDVTSQLQVVQQMKILKENYKVSLMIVSHNFGIVAGLSDVVAIMYGGIIVEYGKAEEILENALHPYTKALIAAIPDMEGNVSKGLPGMPPSFTYAIKGCPFAERCSACMEKCRWDEPEDLYITQSHYVKCFLYKE